MKGKFILLIGPTGSGKGTLLAHVKEKHPEFVFPVSCTTRAMRPGEVNGLNYYFITQESFEERKNRQEFLEWANYAGNFYGTLKSEILTPIKEGKIVVREVEVQGARQILEAIPKENLVIIFIDAGSWDELEQRIIKRAPIGLPEIEKRRKRYDDEVSFKDKADFIIKNEDGKLDEAFAEIDRVLLEIVGR